MIKKEDIKKWFDDKRFPIKTVSLLNLIHQCFTELSQDKWVSVDSKPVCEFEATEWDDSGEICTFDGWVSNTVHVSDGSSIGMGHYKDDGTWRVYEGEFDCMIPDPDKITHWKPLELPNDK